MLQESTEHHRRRAQELRTFASLFDDRQKHDTLRWLARDHEKLAEHEESDLALLIRRLHMMHMAEQVLPRGRFADM